MKKFEQLILLILDGFGVASSGDGNAVSQASPRNINYLVNNFSSATLQASGPSVGLPWGERGNSEVGHLNLGAGRIVSQDLPRITKSITLGEFFKIPGFLKAIQHVKKNQSKLHLIGLVSQGGVHSIDEHLYALIQLASEQGVRQVYIHFIADGRDTPQKIALDCYDRLSRRFLKYGIGRVGTVMGRFYAMDRAEHWELTEQAYRAIIFGEGKVHKSFREAVSEYYDQQIFDEMIPPTVITDESGQPVAKIEKNDAVVFFNFRPDRMRQLSKAMVEPNFSHFNRSYPRLENIYFVTMTEYDKNLPVDVAFSPQKIPNCLSEVISKSKLTQHHFAESEKYAHVTSFFNGGREEPFPGEGREIVSSPKAYQKRYADVPEMSVAEMTVKIIEKLRDGTNFILANFANPDMVGHTGNFKAGVAAVRAIDESIGSIFRASMETGAVFIITADHGNIEQLVNIRTGQVDTEHSLNPVPFILSGPGLQRKQVLTKGYLELPALVPDGVLSDVAPTVLELLGIQKPPEMTAVSLLEFLNNKN